MKLSQLNDKQWSKLIDEYLDINVDHDWWDFTYDDLTKFEEAAQQFLRGKADELYAMLEKDYNYLTSDE